jgi:hypothetical protein
MKNFQYVCLWEQTVWWGVVVSFLPYEGIQEKNWRGRLGNQPVCLDNLFLARLLQWCGVVFPSLGARFLIFPPSCAAVTPAPPPENATY